MAVDESNGIRDSAQLLIFIRSLPPDFELPWDFLSTESLHGNTQGEDIFQAVRKSCLEPDLDMKCLMGVSSDGAIAMKVRQQGFATRLTKFVDEEFDDDNVTSIHCINHQEALRVKVTDFSDTLSQVRQIIIYIRSNALRHRQSRALLDDNEESLEDVLYYIPVRWLSQGQTGCRVLNLRQEISTSYATNNKQCPLDNSNFLVALAFPADVRPISIAGINACRTGT